MEGAPRKNWTKLVLDWGLCLYIHIR